MIYPDKKTFLEKAEINQTIPISCEILADLETPVSALLKTNAVYLLESVENGTNISRYSFLGIPPFSQIIYDGNEIQYINEEKIKETVKEKNILTYIKNFVQDANYKILCDLPPFSGGIVGYFAYEIVKKWERLPEYKKNNLGLPLVNLLITKSIIVFDSLTHKIKIITNCKVNKNLDSSYNDALEQIYRIKDLLSASIPKEKLNHFQKKDIASNVIKVHSTFSKDKYMEAVKKCKQYIVDGDIIQVVLSQRFKVQQFIDSLSVYRFLRTINPSPYMFFLNFMDHEIFGSSPEVMVRVRDKEVLMKPIAGTRKRGATEKEDIHLEKDLLGDEKERAEHIMLVDLARNDLGRICVPHSINVGDYMSIERYSHVMHIVSTVTGLLKEKVASPEVLPAVFPAGTLSGAPKIRAMEIIEELEPVERGPYGGMIAYFSYTGSLDSCITIRTMIRKGENFYVQAGAGIVADSDPEKEYVETLNKANALVTALRQVLNQVR